VIFAGGLAIVMGPIFGLIMSRIYDPSFIWVMPLLASTLLIDASRGLHESKLQREFSYKSLAHRTIVASVLGGLIGVGMAYLGFGMSALVGSRLASSIIQTLIIWRIVRWVPRLTVSWAQLKPLLRFGM